MRWHGCCEPLTAPKSHKKPRRATPSHEPHLEKKKEPPSAFRHWPGPGLVGGCSFPFPLVVVRFHLPPLVVVCPNSSSSGGSHSFFSSTHLAGSAPPRSGVKSLPIRWWVLRTSGARPALLLVPLVARSEPIGSGSSPPPGVVAFPPPVASFFSRWTRFDPVPSPSAVGHPPFPLMGYFAISFFSLACSFFFSKNFKVGCLRDPFLNTILLSFQKTQHSQKQNKCS